MNHDLYTPVNEELLYLYNTGRYYHAWRTFGAHIATKGRKRGTFFTVWCPDVMSVQAVGDFNGWSEEGCFLDPVGSTGVWSGFIEGAGESDTYKYLITLSDGTKMYKADPFAFKAQRRPLTASVIADLRFDWSDDNWISKRQKTNHFEKPMNIYEVHLGSWKRHDAPRFLEDGTEDEDCFLTYRELADELVPYVKDMGYTHLELMPVMEHPFDGSWGYQITGFYAATSRYGSPEDFMYFINKAHRAGLGIILDWVPGHFCPDEHGLCGFNGSKLYESEMHPQWGTYKFDFARGGVVSFLISNAMYWVEMFHVDGIRIDAVSSMLYLNFGIEDKKDFKYNINGGEENLEAVSFLQNLNTTLGTYYPDVFTVAEESTAWPLVTYPPSDGGLGFHYKWDMGWMNDTLSYFSTDFPYRKGCHNKLTFSMMYAFNENFINPLSHDEVVHGKCSILNKMPCMPDDKLSWRRFAGARTLFLYQMTHPGGKLNFMGNEIGEFIEWREYEGLEWFLLEYDTHRKHKNYVRDLNRLYKHEKALWEADDSWDGFSWLDADNSEQNIIIFIRKRRNGNGSIICIFNMSVIVYDDFRIGVPSKGYYRVLFNSDDEAYGGSGVDPLADEMNEWVHSDDIPYHNMPYSISLKLPPLAGVLIKKTTKKK